MKALIIINPKAGRTTEYQTVNNLRKALDGERFSSRNEMVFTNITDAVNICIPDRLAAAS